jgi:hypothetical protein
MYPVPRRGCLSPDSRPLTRTFKRSCRITRASCEDRVVVGATLVVALPMAKHPAFRGTPTSFRRKPESRLFNPAFCAGMDLGESRDDGQGTRFFGMEQHCWTSQQWHPRQRTPISRTGILPVTRHSSDPAWTGRMPVLLFFYLPGNTTYYGPPVR